MSPYPAPSVSARKTQCPYPGLVSCTTTAPLRLATSEVPSALLLSTTMTRRTNAWLRKSATAWPILSWSLYAVRTTVRSVAPGGSNGTRGFRRFSGRKRKTSRDASTIPTHTAMPLAQYALSLRRSGQRPRNSADRTPEPATRTKTAKPASARRTPYSRKGRLLILEGPGQAAAGARHHSSESRP